MQRNHDPRTFGLRPSAYPPQSRVTHHASRFTGFLLSAFCFLLSPSSRAAEAPSTNTPPASPASSSFTNSTASTNSDVVAAVTMDTLDDRYHLALGDRLSFRIQEDEEDPKTLTVTDSGDLEVPYIGRFPAENKTCKQLARELKKSLEKEYYYQATVILAVDSMTRSRGKVYVVGPVRAAGALDVPSDEVLTLSKAIMRAGGFADFADRHNVKVVRKGGPGDSGPRTIVVDVSQILDKGKLDHDLPLEPGDLVLIPERLIRF